MSTPPQLAPHASHDALAEAFALSEAILHDIEFGELPLANVALKAARLARLLNDFDYQRIMQYEAGGYPSEPAGIPQEAWRLAGLAGRQFTHVETVTGNTTVRAYTDSIEQLEHTRAVAAKALEAAADPDVTISSANPHQHVKPPSGNALERSLLFRNATSVAGQIAQRRAFIHDYVLEKHYQLKFSGIAADVFQRLRRDVDRRIGGRVPDAVQKLTAVYDNLRSDNPEDWSNAVHSCRRILQDLADAVMPPQEDRTIEVGGKSKTIKLGPDNYINRLVCYAEDRSDSERFQEIVGSHVKFLGERLDAVFAAAQKGSHSVVARDEADRYVVYTYMLVGDLLSLDVPPAKSA